MKKRFLLIPVLVAMLVGGIACAAKVTLPEGYEQVSPVVSAMGEHWANIAEYSAQARAGLPLGPVYLVHEGEVIGIEYTWSRDMMQEITMPTMTMEGTEVLEALAPLPVGATVDHMDITFVPEGHPGGYEVPHWHIHLSFITQEEKAAITPED